MASIIQLSYIVLSPLNEKNQAKEPKESTSGSMTSIDAETTTSMMVPVRVHHQDCPSVEVSVYALLDDGSDSTFMTNSTLRDLGLKETEVSLKLNTIHCENSIPAQKVEGLVVQKLDKDAIVELPKAYTREAIPARRNQIPTPEIARKWSHLKKIKDKIPPKQNNVEVGLLIGCNCPKALKPKRVIVRNNSDPCAVKTELGWGIIAPGSPSFLDDQEDVSTCHRIVTCKIGIEKLDKRFIVDRKIREGINPFEVRRMFKMDFSEWEQGDNAFSQEDRKFLDIVKCSIRHQDGHYEMPLPIRDKNLLPNRAMAWNRLKPLKKRLESSEAWRKNYMEFMHKVIDSGNAKKVPEHEVTTTDHASPPGISHITVFITQRSRIQSAWYSAARHSIKENP